MAKFRLCIFLLIFSWLFEVVACEFPSRLPYQQGWLGGDVGTSLQLPDGRTFWIFGDSFIQSPKTLMTPSRHKSSFINNSIGLSHCDEGEFAVDYYWGEKEGLQPQSFFMKERISGRDEFYWPLSSFFLGDYIYVNLLRVASDSDNSIGFKELGVDLVRISNWRAKPSEWRFEYAPLNNNGDGVYMSSEAVVDFESEHVYLYGHRSGAFGQENVLGRLSFQNLLNSSESFFKLGQQLEYKTKDESYKERQELSGFDELKVVLNHGNTEMSIFYADQSWWLLNVERRRGLQVFARSDDEEVLSDLIVLHQSQSFRGPWSKGKVIYEIPETIQGHKRFDPSYFCYAAKAHKQTNSFNRQDVKLSDLRMTYVCNSADFELIYERMDIYTPINFEFTF